MTTTTPESSSAAPAYARIAGALRDRIQAGELGPHALVPSERELSRDFGVSRMTARQALLVLEGEGSVYRRPPRGTFVAEPRLQMRLGSFSEEVRRAGHRPSAEVLWTERQQASPRVASALGLAPGDDVNTLQRRRRVDSDPLAIETTYYPAELTPGLLDLDLSGSLWAVLADQYGLTASRATGNLEVITLDEASSHTLSARAAAPALLLTRHTYEAGGRCIEFARDIYRSDRVSFWLGADLPLEERQGK
jgi:GntR family transcriptional regulator